MALALLVVVGGLTFAGLYLGGVGPFSRSSGTTSVYDFSRAKALANSTASSYAGGYSSLALAFGLNLRTLLTVPVGAFFGGSTCGVQVLAPGAFQVGGSPQSAGSGAAPFWAFLYENRSGGLLLVTVAQDHAQDAAVLPPGSGCALSGAAYASVPSSTVDSTVAAQAANNEGGTGFLSAHPNATGVYLLEGGNPVAGAAFGAQWLVEYTLCNPAAGRPSTEPQFTAVVNALSGAVLAASTSAITCNVNASGGAPNPVGSVLVVGPPEIVSNNSGCAAHNVSDWCYRIPVEASASRLTANSLRFQLANAGGQPVAFANASGPMLLGVETLLGEYVASYSFATASWTTGGNASVQVQDALVLDLGCGLSGPSVCNPTPTGLVLVVEGAGAYSGQVEVALT
ncbi:MAG: hypothetical protein L3J72_02560 [Thermoplasmata archaeon]|nr:hypothetical protein [Thermoplasmata archaeon]